jgi:hypothetical protein
LTRRLSPHAAQMLVDPPVDPWRRAKKNGLRDRSRNPLILLVRLAGFEPTTPWFVAKYSIQLSYSREAADYTTAAAGDSPHEVGVG